MPPRRKATSGKRSIRPRKGRGAGNAGRPVSTRVRDPMSSTTVNLGMRVNSLALFPQRTKPSLVRYYSANTLITGTATANAHVFSANGIYDPDITSTGGQPLGYGVMKPYYNHYTVVRSRITAIVTNTSASLLVTVGIMKSGSATVVSSIEEIIENGDVVFTVLNASSGGNAAQSSCKLTQSCNCARFQGINNIMDDPDMRGDSASNPSEQMYYHIVCWNAVTATQITIDFQCFLEYWVVFHEPRKAVPGSLSSREDEKDSAEHHLRFRKFRNLHSGLSYDQVCALWKPVRYQWGRSEVPPSEDTVDTLRVSSLDLKECAGDRCVRQERLLVPAEPLICEGRRSVQNGICLHAFPDYMVVNPDPAVLRSAKRLADCVV